MKLRQTEYCHNCKKHVEFEFEDFVGRQVIVCPSCKHEHYREIDEEIITAVRMQNHNYRPGDKIYFAKPIDLCITADGDYPAPNCMPLQCEIKTVLRIEGDEVVIRDIDGKSKKLVTDKRWGRDPRQ